MMPALTLHRGHGGVHALHTAVDRLSSAWEALAVALARRSEGSVDSPERVQRCLDEVQAAELEANALLDAALTTGGQD